MTALEFLRREEVLNLLERASRGAGMPLSVHFAEGSREGPRIMGWGACSICQAVRGVPGGVSACRASRGTASALALKQRRILPFVCHMGLSCVSAPLLHGEAFAVVLGPYCPSEESNALERDVVAGWNALSGQETEEAPVPMGDIHIAPSASAPAVLEWLCESLQTAWEQAQRESAAEVESPEEDGSNAGGEQKRGGEILTESWAGTVAAALAGGDQPRARKLFEGVLSEQGAVTSMRKPGLRQAAALRAVCAVLEAMEQAGMPTEAAWGVLPNTVGALRKARSRAELLEQVMQVLGAARRQALPRKTRESVDHLYPTLTELARTRLEEGLTLEEAARALGESPSAISHRLKRNLGMSFSEYLGRLRVDKAKEMLRRTALPATEIARRVGVRDQSHFSKLFKKFEGVTPVEYRTKYGRKT